MKVTFADKIQHKPYDSNPRVINNSDINQLKQAVNDAIDGAELAEEIEARTQADNAILSTIADIIEDGSTKASQVSLDEEIANRINAIEAERLERFHSDNLLINELDSKASHDELVVETNARLNADGLLQSQIEDKADIIALTIEAQLRASGDLSLQQQIDLINSSEFEYVSDSNGTLIL